MRLMHLASSTRPGRHCWIVVTLCFVVGTGGSWAHGDLDERIEALSRVVAESPQRAEVWLQRADLRRQHGEFSEALADTQKALQLQPDWPPALLQTARILLDQQQYVLALEAANACLTRDPGNADALVIRARSHTHLADTNAAIGELSAALVETQHPTPDLYLERARLQAGLGRFSDAVDGLDEGMARLGETPSLAYPAFEYEREAGDFGAALARLEKLGHFMRRETFLTLKGEVLLEAGRGPEATKVFLEALEVLTNAASMAARSTPRQREALKARLSAGLEKAAQPAAAPQEGLLPIPPIPQM